MLTMCTSISGCVPSVSDGSCTTTAPMPRNHLVSTATISWCRSYIAVLAKYLHMWKWFGSSSTYVPHLHRFTYMNDAAGNTYRCLTALRHCAGSISCAPPCMALLTHEDACCVVVDSNAARCAGDDAYCSCTCASALVCIRSVNRFCRLKPLTC